MSTANQSPEKKIRASYILMSILPLIIMLFLNTVATMPAVFIGIFDQRQSGAVNLQDTASLLESPAAQNALTIGFIVYAITAIIIFFIWYKKAFLSKQLHISNKDIFTPKNIITTIVCALGVSSIISFGLMGVYALAPDIIENYSEIMDTSGLGSNLITTVVYACILGPVAEELMFRGVTQAYLKKSNAHPVFVIVFQAILFGIAHMNLVQGIYAAFLGIFLGFLRYKGGNIRITIFAHIVFNIFGTFGMVLIDMLPEALGYAVYGVFTAASIATLIMLGKTPTAKLDVATANAVVNAYSARSML